MSTNFISYREAVTRLQRAEQAAVEVRLSRVSADGVRYTNLVAATQAETRVSEMLWLEFFDVVLSADPAKVGSAIRTWASDRVTRGQPSNPIVPLVRATSRASLVRALEKQRTSSGMTVTNAMAEGLVDQISDSSRWRAGAQSARDLGLNLAYYTVWATFSVSSEPYGGLPASAAEVACDLGFDDSAGRGVTYSGDLPLLVLEYAPDSLDARFPTMVEAWASPMPNYYFFPAPPGDPWGKTRNWPNAPSTAKQRPEVVHAPSPLGEIVAVAMEIRR